MLTLRNHLCRLANRCMYCSPATAGGREMEELKIQQLVCYVVETRLEVVARQLLILEEFCVFSLRTAHTQPAVSCPATEGLSGRL